MTGVSRPTWNGRYSQAEDLLDKVDEKQENDLVETLRYKGAAQYEQAKYKAAADPFRKALALHAEDTGLCRLAR